MASVCAFAATIKLIYHICCISLQGILTHLIQDQETRDVSFYNPVSKVFIMAEECDWYLNPRPFLYIYKQLI